MADPKNNTQPETLWDTITTGGRIPTDGFLGNRLTVVSASGVLHIDDPFLIRPAGGTFGQEFQLGSPHMCLADDGQFDLLALRSLTVRSFLPATPTETMEVEVFKVHRDTATTGFFTQPVAPAFLYDDSQPNAWTIDLSSTLLPITFNVNTDALLITAEYTPGAPFMRGFHVNWDMQPVKPSFCDPAVMSANCSTSQTWPP